MAFVLDELSDQGLADLQKLKDLYNEHFDTWVPERQKWWLEHDDTMTKEDAWARARMDLVKYLQEEYF